MAVPVNRIPVVLYPDPNRVITRFFMPGKEDRAQSIIQKICDLPEKKAQEIIKELCRDFSNRHRNIKKKFIDHYNNVKHLIEETDTATDTMSEEKKLLIGSYFTSEYSIESTAFFNPSIVEDPDQSNLEQGQKRVILSFRATGEGHISSIVFRNGIIDGNNNITIIPPGRFVDVPEEIKRHVYEKKSFLKKLEEMHIYKDVVGMVMDRLGDNFIYGELLKSIEETKKHLELTPTKEKVLHAINWVASSHYEISFSPDTAISERVIFPVSYSESNGIEDARFVKFTREDGSTTYYATYTAYNGYTILPKLMETKDFFHFKIMPFHGSYAQNKGLALFPRKINGKYAMISRCDGFNMYVMFSNNINIWEQAHLIRCPKYPMEFVKIGTTGSPIETEEGWLLITHGVGPMRTYTLGAVLLDKNDPRKVIAHLKEPLLAPNGNEREGYVPNVVYSCGSLLINGELIISYGMSDYASSFATVSIEALFRELNKTRKSY
jgi:predicted GH43/DUF377 family glycosyl hydrolase